jgi:hypothetical protein
MIQPIRDLSVEVVPQAIVDLPVGQIVGPWSDINNGNDDLDYFEGASFRLDNEVEIAVRHYRGHPENTSTIYIDRRESDVEHITRLIRKILGELHVPLGALRWERKDNPEL